MKKKNISVTLSIELSVNDSDCLNQARAEEAVATSLVGMRIEHAGVGWSVDANVTEVSTTSFSIVEK